MRKLKYFTSKDRVLDIESYRACERFFSSVLRTSSPKITSSRWLRAMEIVAARSHHPIVSALCNWALALSALELKSSDKRH